MDQAAIALGPVERYLPRQFAKGMQPCQKPAKTA